VLNEKREKIFIQKHELVRLLNALSREEVGVEGFVYCVASRTVVEQNAEKIHQP
jgi:hypothetical protein